MLSIDTRNPETAELAIELGAECINDVSGFGNEGMWKIARNSAATFIAMHSLTVPTSREHTLAATDDPCAIISSWSKSLISRWQREGLANDRLILDPGIGFGKIASHSWQLLGQVRRVREKGFGFLIGHSRKSFLNAICDSEFHDRDIETIGISHLLAEEGVDILRIHNVESHQRSFFAKQAAVNYAEL